MYRKTEYRQGLDESIPLKEGALLKYSSDGIGGFFKFSVWLIFQVPWSPHFSEPAEGIPWIVPMPDASNAEYHVISKSLSETP